MNAIVKFLAAILGNTLVIQQNIMIIKQKGKKTPERSASLKSLDFFLRFSFDLI